MTTLTVTDPATALESLRRARQQCQTRVVQLSSCRVCANDQVAFEASVALLKDLERQLEEVNNVPTV